MTLRQFLSVLSGNKGTSVTLLNLEETELLTFNIEGYANVESDILDRNVKKVTVNKTSNAVALKVMLFDATEATDPTDPDPSNP